MPEPNELWSEVTRIPRRLQSAPRKRSSGILAAALVVSGTVSVLAALVYWQMQTDRQPAAVALLPEAEASQPPRNSAASLASEPASRPQAPVARSPRKPPAESLPARSSGNSPVEAANAPSRAPRSVEEEKPPPNADAQSAARRLAAFHVAAVRARAALVARDLDEAGRYLAAAEKNVRLPDELAEVTRLRALAEQLKLFFVAVQRGLAKFEPAEEIQIGQLRAAIVEVGPERVTLFAERSQRSYTIATMPADVALFFAGAGADENQPVAAAFFGAFHAVDPEGDRERARALWQRAAGGGVPVENLLAALDGPPLAARREAVPEANLVEAAARQLQGQLAELIVAAERSPQKSRIAHKMLEAARRTDDSPTRYAALRQARDWAVSAGDPAVALAALDELGRQFDVDVLALKSEALGAALAGRVTTKSAAAGATAAMQLSAEAHSEGRAELAGTLADTAFAAARKSRDGALIKRAYRWRSELAESKSGRSKSGPAKR